MGTITAQKMKFSIKDFFSKCDQTRSILRIWSYLRKKSLMENFIFCAVHLVLLTIPQRPVYFSSHLTSTIIFLFIKIRPGCGCFFLFKKKKKSLIKPINFTSKINTLPCSSHELFMCGCSKEQGW